MIIKKLFFGLSLVVLSNILWAIDAFDVDSVRKEGAEAYYNGDYGRAEEFYGKLLTHFQKEGNYKMQADALIFLAEIRRAAGQYDLALALLKEVKTLLNEKLPKDFYALAKMYNRKAAIDFEINKLKSSIHSAIKSIEISDKANLRQFSSSNYNIIGAAYRDLKKIDSSAIYLKKALHVAELQDEKDDVVSAALNIVLLYRRVDTLTENSCDTLLKYARIARRIAKKERLRARLYSIYHELSNAYACKQEYQKAYHFRSKEAELRDSIRNEKSEKRLQEMAALQTIQFEQEKNSLLRAKLTNQRIALFLAIAVLFLISLLTYNVITRNKKLKQLSSALKHSSESLEKQTEELSKSNAVKDKMFTVLAHDIRNPLGSLKGIINLYQDGMMSPEELSKYFEKISSQLTQTEVLLDNLLSWSRNQVDQISVNKSFINLFVEISEEMKGLRHIARQKEIDLILECPSSLEVSADKNVIKFVIRNLTTNALKFSEKGSEVKVLVGEKHDPEKVTIQVRDEGLGMSQEQVQSLFEGLGKKSLGTQSEKGSGLGLFMCRELAQKHGGDIYVSSELGKGSTFTFDFPKR